MALLIFGLILFLFMYTMGLHSLGLALLADKRDFNLFHSFLYLVVGSLGGVVLSIKITNYILMIHGLVDANLSCILRYLQSYSTLYL